MALVNDAGKAGLTGLTAEHPRVGEAPFDSGRKMMSVVVETLDGEYEQYTKGAPDVVIGLCTHIYDGDKVVPLTEERRAELVAANKAMADEALRVLALASRTYTEVPSDCSPAALEHDLVFWPVRRLTCPSRSPTPSQATMPVSAPSVQATTSTPPWPSPSSWASSPIAPCHHRCRPRPQATRNSTRTSGTTACTRVQPEHKTHRRGLEVARPDRGHDGRQRRDARPSSAPTSAWAWALLVPTSPRTSPTWCSPTQFRHHHRCLRRGPSYLRPFVRSSSSCFSNLAEVFSVFIATLIGFTILWCGCG
ncbi:MAG: hypothetical protein ACLTYW_07890 [Collinsella sp.]